MSSFEVKIYKLEIIPHPNADKIDLAKVGDYVSIVKKGDFKTGDLGVYIPEASLVPQTILEDMGLVGKLSGSAKNKVKAIRLRGVLSQGLVYKPEHPDWRRTLLPYWKEDTEVANLLGITKWEPVIPQHLRGKTASKRIGEDLNITIKYDIENVKKYNTVFQDGELVQITEKIHGTNIQLGCVARRLSKPHLYLGMYTVSSKGLGGQGVLLDFEDQSNVYAGTAKDNRYGFGYKLPCIRAEYQELIGDEPIYACGEVFGPGIQRGYSYGVGATDTEFRLFDIAFGERANLRYMDAELVEKICKDYEIPMVPVLYKGPFSKEILLKHTDGKETVSGKSLHIREGAVVKPLQERIDSRAGRVILKSVSAEYLLKDNTEYQ